MGLALHLKIFSFSFIWFITEPVLRLNWCFVEFQTGTSTVVKEGDIWCNSWGLWFINVYLQLLCEHQFLYDAEGEENSGSQPSSDHQAVTVQKREFLLFVRPSKGMSYIQPWTGGSSFLTSPWLVLPGRGDLLPEKYLLSNPSWLVLPGRGTSFLRSTSCPVPLVWSFLGRGFLRSTSCPVPLGWSFLGGGTSFLRSIFLSSPSSLVLSGRGLLLRSTSCPVPLGWPFLGGGSFLRSTSCPVPLGCSFLGGGSFLRSTSCPVPLGWSFLGGGFLPEKPFLFSPSWLVLPGRGDLLLEKYFLSSPSWLVFPGRRIPSWEAFPVQSLLAGPSWEGGPPSWEALPVQSLLAGLSWEGGSSFLISPCASWDRTAPPGVDGDKIYVHGQ